MGEFLIADCETDGFLDKMTKLHMIQLGSIDDPTDNVVYGDHPLCDRPLAEGVDRLRAADRLYFHNGIRFDRPAIERFHPGAVPREKLWDTLIMSQLAFPKRFQHSLKSWGLDLHVQKDEYTGDYQEITQDFVDYARQDIITGRAMTKHLLDHIPLPESEEALRTEFSAAYWVWVQEQTGFHLDVAGAEKLYWGLVAKKRDLEAKLRAEFPPRWKSLGLQVSWATNSKFGYTKGSEWTRVVWDEFEPSNRIKAAERLVELGWKPKEFNQRGPVMDDEVLEVLSTRFPAAALMREYFGAEKQAAEIGGDGGWLKNLDDQGRVHGRVRSLGAYTQRMAHSQPNMAKIPKAPGFRDLWIARPGWWLVGCDGEGIQARGMAHYLHPWDGGHYARIIDQGRKEDRSDIHSLNVAGIEKEVGWPAEMAFGHQRDTAKNCNYAVYFGAQDPRLGATYKAGIMNYAGLRPPRVPNRELGGAIRRGISHNMRGLFFPTPNRSKSLSELVEETTKKRKWLKGLDGRRLHPPSPRLALVTLIQSFEAIVMKTALRIWADEMAPKAGLEYGVHWEMVANVHDEIQFQCPTERMARHVGRRFAHCIWLAGRRLGALCPLKGDFTVGRNWHETH